MVFFETASPVSESRSAPVMTALGQYLPLIWVENEDFTDKAN